MRKREKKKKKERKPRKQQPVQAAEIAAISWYSRTAAAAAAASKAREEEEEEIPLGKSSQIESNGSTIVWKQPASVYIHTQLTTILYVCVRFSLACSKDVVAAVHLMFATRTRVCLVSEWRM